MEENSVRSLERAFAILQCFDLETEELNLTQITGRLSLAPATALRLINSLTQLGYLEKSKTKTYSLGVKVYLLGMIASNHFKLRRASEPILQSLRDTIKEAVSLYGIEGEHRVCYEHAESLQSMRSVVRIGERFPLWAGAAGKCLLAYAEKMVVEREMAKIVPLTPSTIVDKELFLKELEHIRGVEEAISYGEREVGVVSIAVPIFSIRNDVEYALSVAVPSGRAAEEALRFFIDKAKDAARAISKQLYS
jgi:DNA-binding IclR family transcriptional regulator